MTDQTGVHLYVNNEPVLIDDMPRYDLTDQPIGLNLADVICVCDMHMGNTIYRTSPEEKLCHCMSTVLTIAHVAIHDFGNDSILLCFPAESCVFPWETRPLADVINCKDITLVIGTHRTLEPEKHVGIKVINWSDYFLVMSVPGPDCIKWLKPRTDIPSKLFTCFNNKGKHHREALMNAFIELGTISPMSNHLLSEKAIYSYKSMGYTVVEEDNMTSKQTMKAPFTDIYCGGLIDVVTETEGVRTIRWTEKTSKPLLKEKPFLIMGAMGTNEALKEYGFKQYPIFDYSFDSIPDMTERAMELAKQIDQYTNEDIPMLWEECKEIAKYNRERLFKIASRAKIPVGFDVHPDNWTTNLWKRLNTYMNEYYLTNGT